eukprot:EG_transcript_12628
MTALLPVNVWEHVHDYLETRELSHVCSDLWLRLRWRHVRGTLGHRTAAAKAAVLLAHAGQVRTLNLRCRSLLRDGVLRVLAVLSQATGMAHLTLDLTNSDVGDAGAQFLAELWRTRKLLTLRLYLPQASISGDGVEALAGLRECPTLRTLELFLWGNFVDKTTRKALMALGTNDVSHCQLFSLIV